MKIEKQSSKFIKPSIPTPPTLRHYKLGFLDELAPDADCSICLFFPQNSNQNPKFLSRIETSLEKTLTRFYPLAGRYVAESQTIDCNDQGAEFIDAKVDIKLQDILVSESDNVMFIDEFISSKLGAAHQLNDPLLAIQVTTFACGGVAIGIRATHKIVDASTLCTFVNEWAAMNREENDQDHEFTGPGFNSSSLFPARGFCSPPLQLPKKDMLINYTRIKLSFSETVISNMKVKTMINNGKSSTYRLSKVQLVLAIIWKALIGVDRAIHEYPRESIFFQAVNLREKMLPLIPKNSCGNFLGFSAARSKTLDTHKELTDVLSDSVRQTISNFSKTYHDNEEGQMMVLNSFPHMTNIPESANVFVLSSWCKFPFYADFGFGKPVWVAPGTIPAKNTGYLMDDAEGKGVEAYVFLEVKDVPYFKKALDVDTYFKEAVDVNGFKSVD